MRAAGIAQYFVLAATVGAVVACGSPEAGAPTPVGQQPPAAGSSPARLAPPVPTPRDPLSLVERPCEALPPELAAAVGLDQPGVQTELAFGTLNCTWQDSEHTREVSLSVERTFDQLDGAYRIRDGYEVFEPVTVGDLPGVVLQRVVDQAVCDEIVSLNESQSLTVSYRDLREPPENVCGEVRRVTELIVSRLPPKKG